MKNKSKESIAMILVSAIAIPAAAVKTIPCDDAVAKSVTVPVGRVTVLSFPTTPKEIVPGEAGFDFKTIRHDLVIKVMRVGAKTNLFVYLEGRRCAFHLAGALQGDEILFVKDPKDKTIEVKFNER